MFEFEHVICPSHFLRENETGSHDLEDLGIGRSALRPNLDPSCPGNYGMPWDADGYETGIPLQSGSSCEDRVRVVLDLKASRFQHVPADRRQAVSNATAVIYGNLNGNEWN